MKNYYVYKHTFPNGKIYIGITCKKPKDRWRRDGSGYLTKKKNGTYKQPLMAHAVIKYGWDSVEHEILFSGLTKEEAENKEQELIAKYKSNICNNKGLKTAGGYHWQYYIAENKAA